MAFSTAQEYDIDNLKRGIVGKDLYELIEFDDNMQSKNKQVKGDDEII